MSQSEDAKYLASLKKRYKKASKKERSKILDEYVETTGYHRKHAIAVLSGQRTRKPRPIRRPRSAIYLMEDARALERLGDVFDGINSKLLGGTGQRIRVSVPERFPPSQSSVLRAVEAH